MQTFWQDIRFALRQLRKSPVFAATAILTLAIGIGANAAIFTLIDDAMLRSLPVLRPDELVTVGFKGPKLSEIVPAQSLSGLDQLRLQLKSVQGLSGWSYDMLSVPDQQGTLRSIGGLFPISAAPRSPPNPKAAASPGSASRTASPSFCCRAS